MMKTPVAFLIFNRPDTTAKVFAAIRQAKPPKLLVVADGPRSDRPSEAEKCAAARAIIDFVDWECEVLTNYSDINIGCGKRISSGINWVFEQVEEAIILEDDCLASSNFFQFCELMLNQYRHDERIMMISGTNFLGTWKSNIQSYHFSYYGGIWGWASWRRAWRYYNYEIKLWTDNEIKARIHDVLANKKQYIYREKIFEQVYNGMIDTWDYQWSFARLLQSGLSIVPSANLISNIGFGNDATHTKYKSEVSNIELKNLDFPLDINKFIAVDRDYDQEVFYKLIKNKNLFQRAIKKLSSLTMQHS
ncbi:MAG: glycosyltransferase family 2 protein [Nostoc sp.]|uniref:glycosyltransferase family 2 protein n=1 Tax=Nostoc sp. TaxID=1180 RepID=UPI002FFCDA4C